MIISYPNYFCMFYKLELVYYSVERAGRTFRSRFTANFSNDFKLCKLSIRGITVHEIRRDFRTFHRERQVVTKLVVRY